MKFEKEKTKDIFLLDTNVENMFINEYMISATGEYVKVYLFALMYANLGVEISNEDISKQLSIDIEDVLKAWTYWEKMGAIRKIKKPGESSLEYDVVFLLLKEKLYGSHDETNISGTDFGANSLVTDKEYKEMFNKTEKLLGRTISGVEMGEILSWISDFGIEPEVVSFAFEYCAQKNKKSLSYTEAVVRNWVTEGYITLEQIENHIGLLEGRSEQYRRVFKALGFHRNWTEEEGRIMDKWFGQMNFDIDLVLEACKKTSGIASPNINYVNRILENIYAEGGRLKTSSGLSNSKKNEYYQALREKEEREAEERKQEVYSKVPRIKEIEDKENMLGKTLSTFVVSDQIDKVDAISKIKKESDSLNTEKAFLLTDNGFELDYMDVRYHCHKCKDTGMLETGERCECFEEITAEKINLLKTKK